MKLTKKQRHEIYKMALKKITHEKYVHICHALRQSVRGLNSTDIEETFPEFIYFSPTDFVRTNISWMDTRLKTLRQQILMFCIEMTK